MRSKLWALGFVFLFIVGVVARKPWLFVWASFCTTNFVRRPIDESAPPEVLDLLQADSNAYPVRISLYYEGHVYAHDWGTISLTDGWMHYEGLSFTFDLCAADFVSRTKNGFGSERVLRDGTQLQICVTDEIAGERQWSFVAPQTYALKLEDWFERRLEVEGRSLYPPLRPPLGAKDPEAFQAIWIALIIGCTVPYGSLWLIGAKLVLYFLPLMFLFFGWVCLEWRKEVRRWRRIQNRALPHQKGSTGGELVDKPAPREPSR